LSLIDITAYSQEKEESQIEQTLRQKQVEYMQKFMRGNFTEDQIRTYLTIEGISESDISRFILEFRKAKTQQLEESQMISPERGIPREQRLYPETETDTISVRPEIKKDIEEEVEKLEPFGLKYFREAGTLFEPDIMGPVDENYILGPGDEIIIVISGDTESEQRLTANREGLILVRRIGQVSVNGLTLSGLHRRLMSNLSKKLSGLTGGENATTFLEVSLGKIRSILVYVTGEIKQPGGYSLSAVSTAFTALYIAGGPTENGSLRSVEVIRNNEIESKIDFYDYLLRGISSKDIRLYNGDMIRIPLKQKEVTVTGEIKRFAIYELLDNETLSDLVRIAGGLKSTAYYERAQIDRIVPFEERKNYKEDKIVIDVNLREVLSNQQKMELADLDSITIFPIRGEQRNYAHIHGAVKRPGKYQLEESMTIKDLINKANGLLDEAFTEKAELVRKNEDGSEMIFSINLEKCLADDQKENMLLVERDSITVRSRMETEALKEKKVSIDGKVKNPGSYKFVDDMKIYDLLIKGGLLDKDYQKGVYLERGDIIRRNENSSISTILSFNIRKIFEGDSTLNIELQSLDSVVVYGLGEIVPVDSVSIYGGIKFPGKYPYHSGITLRDLFLQAGGMEEGLYIDAAEVSRVSLDEETGKRKVSIIEIPVEFDGEYNIVKEKNEFTLQKSDIVFLRENPQWELQENVEITGEVKYPGVYSLLTKEDRLRTLMRRAGGILPTAFLEGAKFIRSKENVGRIALNLEDVMKDERSEDNIVLFSGDHIHIPEIPKSVKVSGEVGLETSIIYKRGKKISYYIAKAGGFSANADKGRTIVVQPNGISEKVKRLWFDPEPKPGSEIMVPPREEGDTIDYFGFFREVITTVANAAVLIIAITRK